jgi:hypothetical protein
MAEEQLSVQQVNSSTSKSTCTAAASVPLGTNTCSLPHQGDMTPEQELAEDQEHSAASTMPLPFLLDQNGKKQPLPGSRSIFIRGI